MIQTLIHSIFDQILSGIIYPQQTLNKNASIKNRLKVDEMYPDYAQKIDDAKWSSLPQLLKRLKQGTIRSLWK